MAFNVEMPALGESVTEGTITRWLKQEGETVEVDEPLLEVSTDKVDTEVPSPAAGVVQQHLAAEDDTVEVGAQLAVIGDSSEADSTGAADGGGAAQEAPAQEAPAEQAPAQQAPAEQAPAQEAPAQQAPAQEAPAQQAPAQDGQSVTMPELGESVTEGTITRWLKQVGETVEVDEPLLEISTDKVDTEVPSPLAGTVLEHTAGEDDTVEVGSQLAVIGAGQPAQQSAEPAQQQPTQQAPAPEAPAQPTPAPEAPAQQPQPDQQAPAQQAPAQQAPAQQAPAQQAPATGEQPYVTPLVRKLASEQGVDLTTVTGTGVGGRIRKQDVVQAAEAARPAATAANGSAQQTQQAQRSPSATSPASQPSAEAQALRGKTEKMSRLRQIVAERTRESLQVSAQLTQVVEVDVTRIAGLRGRAKSGFQDREGVKLTFLPFFAKAVVEALKQHPKLNASIDEENRQVTYHGSEHLGIAVDTDRGLLTPVIHEAGDLSLAGLARQIADLAERTRSNKISPDELSGGTFTLTNIGSQGALTDTPIIVQPQVGILGTGAIVKRPAVISGPDGEDTVAVRSMCHLPMTYDHRLVDGADAGRFLSTVKQRLEQGAFEADLGL